MVRSIRTARIHDSTCKSSDFSSIKGPMSFEGVPYIRKVLHVTGEHVGSIGLTSMIIKLPEHLSTSALAGPLSFFVCLMRFHDYAKFPYDAVHTGL